MKRPDYPKYRKSGIDWFGSVPEHWELKRLKFVASTVMGQSPSSEDYSSDASDTPFLQGNAEFGARHPEPRIYCATAAKTVSPGTILVSVRAPVGALNVSDQTYGIGRGLCGVMPSSQLHDQYAWYVLSVSREDLFTRAAGSTYEAVSAREVGCMSIPIPPLPEQRAIAHFLDCEASGIDTLIAKKQTLLDLLKEKRSALISQSVTKGLDPNVPTKPSGIDWLGDIPKHWETKRLKFLLAAPLKYGANEAAELDNPDLPRYVRITDIDENDGLRDETFKSLPVDVASEYLLRDGDLLFARSGATTGKTFLYRQSWGTCAYAGYLIRARLDQRKCAPGFVRYFTASINYWQWIASATIQATIQNVSAERYSNLRVPLPPLSEQIAITAYLDRENAKIDGLAANVASAIARLQEYRSALITAAVTGKIDVRQIAELAELAQ